MSILDLPRGDIESQLPLLGAELTVDVLFRSKAKFHPHNIAIEQGGVRTSYAELYDRVNRLTHVLAGLGIKRGDRIAILSENRREYLELILAAACLGAIAACLNFRLSEAELTHCLQSAEPKLVVGSEKYSATVSRLEYEITRTLVFGEQYEHALTRAVSAEFPSCSHPEDGLLILYTSGTTGLPKGALISQRAEIARCMIGAIDGPLWADLPALCWAPFCHIATADLALGAMMLGLKLHIMDGFDSGLLLDLLAREPVGNVSLMPAVIGALIDELKRTHVRPKYLRTCGGMADLVTRQQIGEISGLLNAEYRNTFGATETGQPPLSRNRFPIGIAPDRLSKSQSSFCQIKLVDPEGQDVDIAQDKPGELLFRGPTLFSGYWRAPEVNETELRGGWFQMGDVMKRNPDGTFDFVDRRKYLIKSGGENIYPAEIERLLLSSARIREAIVVRKHDAKWGEVPVAFIVKGAAEMTVDEAIELCRGKLANFKVPKEVHFIAAEDVPRSATGKVKRHELEAKLEAQ